MKKIIIFVLAAVSLQVSAQKQLTIVTDSGTFWDVAGVNDSIPDIDQSLTWVFDHDSLLMHVVNGGDTVTHQLMGIERINIDGPRDAFTYVLTDHQGIYHLVPCFEEADAAYLIQFERFWGAPRTHYVSVPLQKWARSELTGQ